MKNKTFKIRPISLALLLAGIGMTPASYAVNLAAVEGTWNGITMWGFANDTGDCATAPTVWNVGPQLTDTDLVTGDLTITLRNCLSEPVSIVIPGQPATFAPVRNGDGRVTAFTTEAPADGGATTTAYTWTGVKAGTYLYQSGSHPAKQVQMGLYGALTVGTYPGTSGDVTLLYSEIDPVLHNPPAAATPLGYKPRHFLVNGSASQPTLNAGDTSQPTVLRFLNAGLDFHVPTLNGGYMSLVAEDGNLYPFPKQQYSVNLAAGKTIDALWQPATEGTHVIYDRRGNGMAASLTVAAVGGPVAGDDAYSTDEDVLLEVTAPGVLDNDDPSLTAILVSAPSNGILSPSLAGDGSFTYTPNDDFNGTDSFTYKGNDGTLDSNIASVTISVSPVNDAPVAGNNAYDAVDGTTLNVAAPGVLGNDSDVDGDSLTATIVTGPINGGILVLNADGSFDYTPTVPAPAADSFTYEACDAEPLCDTATVSINIIAATNVPPVAVNDTATVDRIGKKDPTTFTFINLTANDTDADGNLKVPSITGNVPHERITIDTTGTNGTVSKAASGNGVYYTPKVNWQGTDTLTYTVTDLAGATSNVATVTVNVVKP